MFRDFTLAESKCPVGCSLAPRACKVESYAKQDRYQDWVDSDNCVFVDVRSWKTVGM